MCICLWMHACACVCVFMYDEYVFVSISLWQRYVCVSYACVKKAWDSTCTTFSAFKWRNFSSRGFATMFEMIWFRSLQAGNFTSSWREKRKEGEWGKENCFCISWKPKSKHSNHESSVPFSPSRIWSALDVELSIFRPAWTLQWRWKVGYETWSKVEKEWIKANDEPRVRQAARRRTLTEDLMWVFICFAWFCFGIFLSYVLLYAYGLH